MTIDEIRQRYLQFFTKRRHAKVPSAPLVPENDPTTLFVSSGMQPLLPHFLGVPHPQGKRIVNIQKCLRTQDIDKVGDTRHSTFFEMLGNWSFGDYFKKEQLNWFFEFLTSELGLEPERLYVTVFEGDKDVQGDRESAAIWQEIFRKVGLEAKEVDKASEKGMQEGRIFYYGVSKNWWSRTGEPKDMPIGEPGGPDSEVFFDFGEELRIHENSEFKKQVCHVNCDCGRFFELGNSVFIMYRKNEDGRFEELPEKNIDFGGGLERLAAATQDQPDIFQTKDFLPLIEKIASLTAKKYDTEENKRAMRIVVDHIRAATFIIADGVVPSNKDRGAVLRRLISRTMSNASQVLRVEDGLIKSVAFKIADFYKDIYPELFEKKGEILSVFDEEEVRFRRSIRRGLKELEREKKWGPEKVWAKNLAIYSVNLDDFQKQVGYTSLPSVAAGTVAFNLGTSYGLPVEYSKPLLEEWIKVEREFEKTIDYFSGLHKNLSRKGVEKRFAGGLADYKPETVRLHTAAHLLHAALRQTLGGDVWQKGQNITSERLRFDFSYVRKLREEQIKKIEEIVNEKIRENLAVWYEEMSQSQARERGAIGLFGEKYPERVKVYFISSSKKNKPFSVEYCGGPHVGQTGEIGGIKIVKEKSVGAKVRRLYLKLKE